MEYYQDTINLIEHDSWRMRCLQAVASITEYNLWIGGGFLRNAIWDYIFKMDTPLRDIDVVYVDINNTSRELEIEIENKLKSITPEAPWEVNNCVREHKRQQIPLPVDIDDAIACWPEITTCIACQIRNNQIVVNAPYGLYDCWHGIIRHNPRRSMESIIKQRVQRWKKIWSQLIYL